LSEGLIIFQRGLSQRGTAKLKQPNGAPSYILSKGIIMFKFTMGFAIGVFASPIIMPVVANKLNDVLSTEHFRRVAARTRNSYIR
jgi:hypothetical protein